MKRTLTFCATICALTLSCVLALAQNDPPCTPTTTWCDDWDCMAGSVNNPGTLSKTSDTICVGGSTSSSVSGTTFNNGSKTHTCYDDCGTSWSEGPIEYGYTAVSWWEPPIPSSFPDCGTFIFTAKVKGVSNDSDCPDETDPVTVGTFTVKVLKVEITPATATGYYACAVNNTVTFSLTPASCPGSGVTWSISPTVADGATIAGVGNTATVSCGKKPGTYTITATAIENQNCKGTATLTVVPDCDCTHHVISQNPIFIPGGGDGWCRPTDSWTGAPLTDECGNVVQQICAGSIYIKLNGADVGHCPYNHSDIEKAAFKCKCSAVFMHTAFTVVDDDPASPTYGNGKDETWTCGSGYVKNCFTLNWTTGATTPRVCTAADN